MTTQCQRTGLRAAEKTSDVGYGRADLSGGDGVCQLRHGIGRFLRR
uniref:Uncharacterized protein n=1 Tax=Ralstonia solanacearum TaxID=305 RepID=A0A0S4VWB2_RALSL|nr:protein of unknown function [Ralstonia solanacearum]CUV36075.1 protein of unknown function [Ralstonia solanacearum]CUV38844.1 protein of unknown function [Ralstonia solanacearum]CUV63893.1 protein of unknown function [Ralstonia solanacearum]